MLKPDLKLLIESLHQYGLIQPIVVRKQNNQIIDGHHRFIALQSDKSLLAADKGKVPVVMIDCSEIQAMLMHISLNRAKGDIVLHHLSRLVKQIKQSGVLNLYEMEQALGMTSMELDALLDGPLIKSRKVSEHQYSKAWIPVEAKTAPDSYMSFEKPPNPDR